MERIHSTVQSNYRSPLARSLQHKHILLSWNQVIYRIYEIGYKLKYRLQYLLRVSLPLYYHYTTIILPLYYLPGAFNWKSRRRPFIGRGGGGKGGGKEATEAKAFNWKRRRWRRRRRRQGLWGSCSNTYYSPHSLWFINFRGYK